MEYMDYVRAVPKEAMLQMLIGAGGLIAVATFLTLSAMAVLGLYKLFKRLTRA